VLAAAIITGLRLALDPRAGSTTERVIDAVEDGIFLANQLRQDSAAGSVRGILILGRECMFPCNHESDDPANSLIRP
jgi:hypothetical protein